MRFIFILIVGIFLLTLVSANQTNYSVHVHDGWGVGSGDSPPQEGDPPEDDEPEHYEKDVEDNIKIKIEPKQNNYFILLDDEVKVNNKLGTNTTAEPPKEPINWTPIIIWGMVIIFLIALVGGGWYVYQIYFY